jgi:hypothetical protein
VAFPNEFWAAIMGGVVASAAGYLVQRAQSIRAGRAGILGRELRDLINWAEGHHHSLQMGQGPWQLSEDARLVGGIQRQALALGSRDYRAAARLSGIASGLIELDHKSWHFTSIGVEPRMDVEEALSRQMNVLRLSLRGIYGYEHWLRRRLAWFGRPGTRDVDGPFIYPHEKGRQGAP